MALDLVIESGLVVDGTGAGGQHADLGITGNRIAAVGDLKGAAAARRLDATGCVVAPGFIDTDMTAVLSDEVRNSLLAQIPLKRLGRPEDVAAAVRFLASDEASYITGHVLDVNGGMYM